MIVGLPGAGIGGLFYLLLGLWMPFREAMAMLHGRSDPTRRRQAVRQAILSVSMIMGMGITGALIGWLVTLQPAFLVPSAAAASAPGGMVTHTFENYLQLSMVTSIFLVLIGVILSVHMLRLAVRADKLVRRVKEVAQPLPGGHPEDGNYGYLGKRG